MIEITLEQLQQAVPQATLTLCRRFLRPLNDAMARYDIACTRLRVAHFLAQVAWESGYLRYTEELATGTRYEGRRDLGNTQPGDGPRYKGRGLIQVTGRTNYRLYGIVIGRDMERQDERNWLLLREPYYAADSAGWFWKSHGLNDRADRDEHTLITKVINGSTATAGARLACLRHAKVAMGLIREK